MALPTKEEGVIELVQEEEAQAKRDAALATTEPSSKEVALSQASTVGGNNPMAALAELGIDDIKLDFTSFPIVTLNKAVFSTDEHKSFGTEFEFVYMDKRNTFLFKGDLGRDKEPELVYSDDQVHDNTDLHKPIAGYIEDWKARNIEWDKKQYTMVIGTMVNGPHAGDIVQLQISPSSQGKLGGYLYSLGFSKTNPREVVTKASIGAEIGSGTKAFNPWVFKKV